MRQPRLDAEHLARFFGGVGADIAVLAMGASFDHPKIAHGIPFVAEQLRAESLGHQLRRKTALVPFQITPGLNGLDHMRIGVNRTHGYPSSA